MGICSGKLKTHFISMVIRVKVICSKKKENTYTGSITFPEKRLWKVFSSREIEKISSLSSNSVFWEKQPKSLKVSQRLVKQI
jgi:hypothetical protein